MLDANRSSAPTGGTEAILLVENDLLVRRQVLHALARAGYQVDVAGNAVEGLVTARSLVRCPELLIADAMAPGMSGTQCLARALRRRWLELRVLFTCPDEEDALRRMGPLAPWAELLQKPFTDQSLLGRVRDFLDRASAP